MNDITSDKRIEEIVPINSPAKLLEQIPLGVAEAEGITKNRQRISNLLHGKDRRLLVVVGPCSIHHPDAAIEYADRLNRLRIDLGERLEIVMRVYFEKPRTTVGWKGLINDPHLDNSFDISEGLSRARRLLVNLAGMGMPAGCEFLDAAAGQYYADTVSWGAIGARTTESQVHRELASGLSCPVGFKNGTSGDMGIAIDAIVAAGHKHAFLSPDNDGLLALYKSKGNNDAHLILRGGNVPNYDEINVAKAEQLQQEADIRRRILIDCSHANSGKDHTKQSAVAENIGKRVSRHESIIAGVMIESNLIAGKQKLANPKSLVFGQSITDACIDWAETDSLLNRLADTVPQ